MKNIYRIADITISIESLYQDIHDYCADYRTEGIPDIEVITSQADIDFERSRLPENTPSHDERLEMLAVHRKIAERLPSFSTMLIHGSVLAVDGQAFMFTAPSGTGKSTHARLWRELLGERVIMVNDDKPFLRITNGHAQIFGTPWNGKHRLGTNISFPLKAICIIERSEQNHIDRITMSDAYPYILLQTYRPIDNAMFAKTMGLLDGLAGAVEFYRLGWNMDIQAAELAYNAMKG